MNRGAMEPTQDIMDLKDKQIAMPPLPMFDRTFWFNANPEIVNDLKGNVVVVDFWEYTCVNCIRTFPYV
ncbi:MAG: cytochrome c biogenesis protein DipZ, partial [Bacteroidota bacterium]